MNQQFIQSIRFNWDALPRNSYVRDIAALRSVKSLDFERSITFFVGENGTGKSTLLEAVAVAYGFNPEGGSINFNFSTKDTHSPLNEAITVVKGYRRPRDSYFLRAESFYNVASKLDEYEEGEPIPYRSYGGKSLHEQSHGESFLALMQNRFNGNALYLLDEPEAALSPQRQLAVLAQMSDLAQRGTQFLIATHSAILLGFPGADILSFDGGKIHRISYEETESYQITEMFINQRGLLLKRLGVGEK